MIPKHPRISAMRHNLAISAPSSTLQPSFSAASCSDCPGAKAIRSYSGFHDNPPHVLTVYLGLPAPSGPTATIDDFQSQHQTSSIPNSDIFSSGPALVRCRPSFHGSPFTSARPRMVSYVSSLLASASYRHLLCRRFLDLHIDEPTTLQRFRVITKVYKSVCAAERRIDLRHDCASF
jgi:hypothetical protein